MEPSGFPGVRYRTGVDPSDECAIYKINDRFVDLLGAWQEDKRGLITFLFVMMMMVVNEFILFGVVVAVRGLINGVGYSGAPLTQEGYIFYPIMILLWSVANFLLFKHGLRWMRLEIFTQQRIVIRLNRITRQVHINRPAYAGGIATFPWDVTIPEMTGSDPGTRRGDGSLMMMWTSEDSGAGFDDFCKVGGDLEDRGKAEVLWEYIRRYMEDGLDAVPQPKRLRATFPWPWDSVRSTLSFLLPSWRTGDKGLVLTFALLLSPLLLLHSLCHWISLLLCWPTWWPRIIRRAGLPGAPLPALTVAEDYGPDIARKLRASAMKLADPSP